MSKRLLNFVWDRGMWFRQRKTCRALSEQGWTIDAVVLEDLQRPWPWGELLEFTPPQPPNSLGDRAVGKLRQMLGKPPALYDTWQIPYLEKILKSRHYDAVQWTFLNEACEAADITHSYGCPFILDQLDNFPYNRWSAERDFGSYDPRNNLNRWFQYEHDAIHKADAVLVTIEEMAQRFIGMHYADPDKLFAVQNTEHPDMWASIPHSPDLERRFKDKLVGLYVGGCSRHRGLDVVIKALAEMRTDIPQLHIVVVGDGHGVEEWKNLAESLNVGNAVHFEGQKPFVEAQQYYHIADFGIIPHHKYGQTDNTVPHKLYQNFLMGIPILASSCHPLQRIVFETGGGLIFEAGTPKSATEKLHEMANNKVRNTLSINAKKAMNGKCGWDHMAKTITNAFDQAVLNFKA